MIIQTVHYTLNKNSRYFFQLLHSCWTGVLTVRLVKLSLLNLTAKTSAKLFLNWKCNQKQAVKQIDNKWFSYGVSSSYYNKLLLLEQYAACSVYMAAIIVKKKTVTYANVWLMSEKLDCNEVFYRGVYIADFFFFLKEVTFCFVMSKKLLRLTWGTYFIGSLPSFFPLSLNLPRGMKRVYAYRKHLSKDKQCLKKKQCGWRWQQSSLLFPLHLLLFWIWPSNTRSEIVFSSVIFFSFFLFSHFSKTLRWKTYVAYFKSGRKRRRWTHSLW